MYVTTRINRSLFSRAKDDFPQLFRKRGHSDRDRVLSGKVRAIETFSGVQVKEAHLCATIACVSLSLSLVNHRLRDTREESLDLGISRASH